MTFLLNSLPIPTLLPPHLFQLGQILNLNFPRRDLITFNSPFKYFRTHKCQTLLDLFSKNVTFLFNFIAAKPPVTPYVTHEKMTCVT